MMVKELDLKKKNFLATYVPSEFTLSQAFVQNAGAE